MLKLFGLLAVAGSAAASAASPTNHYHPIHRAVAKGTGEANLPLGGNLLPMGIFYTEMEVGSPPKKFAVTIDTGSTDMLIPLAGCKGCKTNTTLYDPASSSTSQIEECNKTMTCRSCAPNPANPKIEMCSFSDSYVTCDLSNLTASCTVSGVIYRDSISVGGFEAKNVKFGGINRQTDNFDQFKEIDGILGLAFEDKPPLHAMGFDVSPFERLVEQNDNLRDVLQTCMYEEGGLLVFGQDPEHDAQFYFGSLAYTPITLDAWYTVNATALLVEGDPMNITLDELNGPFPSDPCIVDSGTNFLSLTHPAFNAVVNKFQAMCKLGVLLTGICGLSVEDSFFGGKSFKLTDEEKALFPSVSIVLLVDNGYRHVPLPIGPDEYMILQPDGTYRLGIMKGDCILGNTHMIKYWIVYDRANQRVGFAPAIKEKCAQTRLSLM